MKLNNGILQVGDYVSFNQKNTSLYKVLEIEDVVDTTYIFYIESDDTKIGERLEYVTSIFKSPSFYEIKLED